MFGVVADREGAKEGIRRGREKTTKTRPKKQHETKLVAGSRGKRKIRTESKEKKRKERTSQEKLSVTHISFDVSSFSSSWKL